MAITPPRSVRIPDVLWKKAKAKAKVQHTTVTAVIVKALYEAVREFLPLLTEKQTRRFDTNVSYVQGRTNYLENKYKLAVAPLLIVARRGFGQKKLNSIYLLLHISIYMLKK